MDLLLSIVVIVVVLWLLLLLLDHLHLFTGEASNTIRVVLIVTAIVLVLRVAGCRVLH